ncbi:MAG TPA: hypothetical protein VGP09_20385, partial [Caballeronia sp.]|nr:hypothetical protein [Caballeronia sp.]
TEAQFRNEQAGIAEFSVTHAGSLRIHPELAACRLQVGRFATEQPNARSVFQQRRDEAVSACAAMRG